MVIVFCKYSLPVENRSAFVKELDTLAAPLVRKEKGCHQFSYYIPADPNDKTVLLVEKWENQECIDIHSKGEPLKKIFEIKDKYGVATTITKYAVID